MYNGTKSPGLEIDAANSTRKSELAWELVNQGNLVSAMRLFNEAWLLNPDDPAPYWGFAYITGIRSQSEDTLTNLETSIRYYNMARQRMRAPNVRLLSDLAFAHTTVGAYHQANGNDPRLSFRLADEIFSQAEAVDPNFAPMLLNRSFLEYYRENYPRALALTEKAAAYGMEADPDFISELQSLIGRR